MLVRDQCTVIVMCCQSNEMQQRIQIIMECVYQIARSHSLYPFTILSSSLCTLGNLRFINTQYNELSRFIHKPNFRLFCGAFRICTFIPTFSILCIHDIPLSHNKNKCCVYHVISKDIVILDRTRAPMFAVLSLKLYKSDERKEH